MTESQSTNSPLSTEQKLPPINVEIQCIYVKEQSCKVPHTFQTNGQPKNNTEININSHPLTKETDEITLYITFTTKLEQRTLYRANAQQAVVIKTNSLDEKQLSHLMFSKRGI